MNYIKNFKRNGENKMTIEFIKEDEKNYTIEIGTDEEFTKTYGVLKFDDDQNAWVLWPNDIDDGVNYFDDLDESKEAIEDELINAEK